MSVSLRKLPAAEGGVLFSRAAVTNTTNWGGLRCRNVVCLGVGGQDVGRVGSFWRLRENVFQASPPASGGSRPSSVFLGLELHHPISASIFTWPPSLCLSVTASLIRTPVIGFRAHPKSSMVSSRDPKRVTSAKTHFQISSHSEVSSAYYFGGTIQPSMVGDVCEIASQL